MFNTSESEFNKETYLTRFSYEKSEVYVSLYFSVLDKNFDESMFWSYELMRSGFMHELISFYITMHFDFFYMFNEGFENQIQDYYTQIVWLSKQKQTKEVVAEIVHIIANIVYNFVVRPFSILSWLKHLYDVDINVKLESTDYTKRFKDKIPEVDFHNLDISAYNYARYSIRKRESVFMKHGVFTNEETCKNWLSLIQHTPYWKDTILHYGGNFQQDGSVWFPSDSLLEEFIDTYYPDFDNMDIYEKIKYGIVDEESFHYFENNKMTWQEFYQKYYYDITQDERMNSLFSSFDGIGI